MKFWAKQAVQAIYAQKQMRNKKGTRGVYTLLIPDNFTYETHIIKKTTKRLFHHPNINMHNFPSH